MSGEFLGVAGTSFDGKVCQLQLSALTQVQWKFDEVMSMVFGTLAAIAKRMLLVAMAVQAGTAYACVLDQRQNNNAVLHTTISADGQLVASLWNAGTPKQQLCIRHLVDDTRWRSVGSPPLTSTIQFASKGHDLLATHRDAASGRDVLVRMDMDRPGATPVKVYEAQHLAFPVEVSPGRIMVRTRHPADPKQSSRFYLMGYHWILLGPSGQVESVGPDPVLPYSAPNIVGDGFFWVEDRVGPDMDDKHPIFHAYPLPGGVAPSSMNLNQYPKDTFNVRCDRFASRCLRHFIANLGQKPQGSFVYDVEVVFGSQNCKLQGIAGRQNSIDVTPDGNAAVLSVGAASDRPRHVVALKFQPHQCAAVSAQHIYVEEK